MTNIVTKWKFQANADNNCYKLLKTDAVTTDEGTGDALVADIYEMGNFMDFLAEEGGNGTEQVLDDLPASVQFQEHTAWLTLNKTADGFQAGYLHGDGLYEQGFNFTAPTSHEALKRLSAKLPALKSTNQSGEEDTL